MKRDTLYLILPLVCGLGMLALLIFANQVNRSVISAPESVIPVKAGSHITVNLHSLKLEIADTLAAQQRGLGGRVSLASDQGMLFVFDRPGRYPFWMKDVAFPLDIIWLKQGIVQEVAQFESVTDAILIPSYTPRYAADRVIEVNAGVAQQFGLKPGVRVLGLPK